MVYHIAIDIGASSGRHIAAWRENGVLQMKEIYRFPNLPKQENGHLVWDIQNLFTEVVNGLKACSHEGIYPKSVGIDTWAVDYVLLNHDDKPVMPVFCYRDERGKVAAEQVHEIIPFSELYAKTGIQYQPFNTIYQLYWDKTQGRLQNVKGFLMLPEYLSYLLTGVQMHEYTNATSTGLLHARTKQWDIDIIEKLGLPTNLFAAKPVKPSTFLGKIKGEMATQIGFTCDVILPATHDTASAIAALPQKGAYISSGTWSLLGTELSEPVTNEKAQEANFTNEGGIGTIRFLKNIMGLWLVQCLKRELNEQYSFSELAAMAEKEGHFNYTLDVNADRYLAPQSVICEITEECKEKGFPAPKTPGEFAHAIYASLANAYAEAIRELEEITEQNIERLCIVGGGAANHYLNTLTEQAIKRPVITGSSEATALGNILMQEAAYV